MNNEGFVKISRKIQTWEWHNDPTVFCLFVHLIIMANWKEGRFQGKVIKRGQLATSLGSLSVKTGLSIKQIRGALNKLCETHEITSVGQGKGRYQYRIITVLNYDLYQLEGALRASKGNDEGKPKGQAKGTIEGNLKGNNRRSKESKNKEKEKENKEKETVPNFFEWVASCEAPFESAAQRNQMYLDFKAKWEAEHG